jgi:predicted Fe-Mo cluster-binding NifX family protein
VDPEMLSVEAIQNPNIDVTQGAGTQSAQLISNKNVGTVLTGHCGPNAQTIFQFSNIEVITGFKGKVLNALSKYQNRME